MNVNLSVTGTYADTMTFLYDLTRFPKILSVEGAQFTRAARRRAEPGEEAAPQVTTQLKLTAFVFHDDAAAAPPGLGAVGSSSQRARSCRRRRPRQSPGRRAGRRRARSPRRRPPTAAARRGQYAVARERIMGFQKIDKKQMPQVIGLGVVSCGMFGYFAYKMMAPTVSAAPPPTAGQVRPVAAASARPIRRGAGGDVGTRPAMPDAPPPTPGCMTRSSRRSATTRPRCGPAATPAWVHRLRASWGPNELAPYPPRPAAPAAGGGGEEAVPAAAAGRLHGECIRPGQPPAGQPAPMPVAPSWTVTGVSGDGGQVAILRSGEVRQFAHRGDIVGGDFRVVDVTRDSVVLRHGSARYTLLLGGDKPADAKPRQAAQPSGAFAAATVTPAPALQEQTLDQAAQERQALQDTVTKLSGSPQGATDSALTNISSALNQAQDTIGKH